MANGRAGSVIYVDTTGYSLPLQTFIAGVKYIGASGGSAVIYNKQSGQKIWEASGSTNEFNQVNFMSSDGLYVTLASGAVVYIYIDPKK